MSLWSELVFSIISLVEYKSALFIVFHIYFKDSVLTIKMQTYLCFLIFVTLFSVNSGQHYLGTYWWKLPKIENCQIIYHFINTISAFSKINFHICILECGDINPNCCYFTDQCRQSSHYYYMWRNCRLACGFCRQSKFITTSFVHLLCYIFQFFLLPCN